MFFEKLAKNENYHEFLIANLSVNPKLWIRDLAYSEDAKLIYQDWKKRNQALTYIFKSETEKWLCKPFNFNFVVSPGYSHPYILRSYLSNSLCLETFCIVMDLAKAVPHFDKIMEYDPVWDEISTRVKKYTPFIKYDKDKFRKIILDFYDN